MKARRPAFAERLASPCWAACCSLSGKRRQACPVGTVGLPRIVIKFSPFPPVQFSLRIPPAVSEEDGPHAGKQVQVGKLAVVAVVLPVARDAQPVAVLIPELDNCRISSQLSSIQPSGASRLQEFG